MKKTTKYISMLLMLSCVFIMLSGCGSNSTTGASSSSSKKDDNSKVTVEAYVGSYLNKSDIDYEKAEVSKDTIKDLVIKRDYNVINVYSKKDGKDGDILKAYNDALNNVEYTVKSAENKNDEINAKVAIKGIDISTVESEVTKYAIQFRKSKKVTPKELFAATEDKAQELLRAAQKKDEVEIDLNLKKNNDGKYEMSDDSISSLENTLSYVKEEYKRFNDTVPDDFKNLDNTK